jgi:AcrR family transcriptional regulator
LSVLDLAVVMSSEVGLNGLSLGRLADRLNVSKSGLFAHWASKEDLQLATIDHARRQWVQLVVAPGMRAPRGVRRLFAVHEARLDFYARRVLPGGCFFATVEFEFTGRTGAIPDRIATAQGEWMSLLERLVAEAIELSELPATVDPALLAFEVESAGLASLLHSRLTSGRGDYARPAVLGRLRELATDPTLLPAD